MPTRLAFGRSWRLLVAVAAVVGVAGATFGSVAAGSTGASSSIVVRLGSDWQTFDMQVSEIGASPFLTAFYDRLVGWGKDRKLVPYLATSWKQTPTQITFKLRQDAKCSDGTPLTTQAVLNSMRRLFLVPKTNNFLLQYFGPGPYSIHANYKQATFSLAVESPYHGLLEGFASVGTGIVCPAGLAAVARDPHALEAAVYGSGPYTLVSAAHADQIVMKLRPDWKWGPNGRTAKQLPDTEVWKVITDDTTAANLLLTGGLDVSIVSGPDVDRLASNRSLTETKAAIFYPTTLLFNQAPGAITNDLNLRKAIGMAVERNAMNQAAYAGSGIPTVGFNFLPGGPGGTCWNKQWNTLAPKYDLDKANQLLTTSGYRLVDGKRVTPDGKPITLRIVTFVGQGSASEYLAGQMQKLGFGVSVGNLLGGAYVTALFGGSFDIALSSNNGMTTDPAVTMIYFVGKPLASGGLNYSNIGREFPQWEQEIVAGQQTLGKEACLHYDKATRVMYDKMLLDPLVAPVTAIFARRGITFDVGPRTLDPVNILRPKS
jgi:peptide/nickel transport system substrate-binding protein